MADGFFGGPSDLAGLFSGLLMKPPEERPAPPRLRVEDFDASTLEVLQEIVRTRPVQFLAKLFAGSLPAGLSDIEIPIPLGGGEVSRKTQRERLLFELQLAQREVQGRKLQEEILARQRARGQAGGLLSQ